MEEIDVSKCEFYGDIDKKCYKQKSSCDGYNDCVYKQLKEKEKECEELKEDVKHQELEIQDWIKQYKLAHLKCHYLEPSIKQYINNICEKYDVCEKTYHEKIATILRDYEITKSDLKALGKLMLKQQDITQSYWDRLQEIKEIAKERCINYPNCACKKIVQKISKVEE